ncbi:MAG: twin-arginine translocase subunit TatB [Gammaproteobacteria bacterium]|nr:twin-arginine translocase subunit TatB [Gammaproteobacteria bacterium]
MFDVGMFEMVLIGVIALLILGPERMPEAARAAGRWVGKMRGFVTGIKDDVKSQMSVAEMDELRQLRNDLTAAQTNLGKMQQNATTTLNEQVSVQATASESLKIKNKTTDQA